ncbi:outer membrane protein transport protein [Lysobacter capsici]|jgi:long-chain fatty acid transport protein|uniref:OmpP1/FadL family transporter n=1 Tax=Lysobacter capsici TaxID=435897 RepID=UPI001783F0B4|nr:outer membrane protein transport protein [Lysobacter capsici]UOF15459.1 outer membrane protein transport protein [Lysobacter capsici]
MQPSHRYTRLTAIALGIAGVISFGSAGASGFQIRENSVKNQGRAFAGSAVAKDDASVVSNNPAAMVNLDSTTVRTDVTVIDLTAKFRGGGTSAAGTPLTGGNGGDPGDAQPVPALAIVVPLSGAFDKVTLGASVSAPFGLKTEYDRDWVGRYHAVESDVKTIDLTLSAAVALTDRFSVGFGVVYERAEVTLTSAADLGSLICAGNPACRSPASPFGPQRNDGLVDVTGDDNGLGWLVGFQFKPTDKLSIGYSHRSEIDHDISGTVDFTVPAAVAGAAAGNPVLAARIADGPGGAKLTTPSVDTLSVSYAFTDNFRMMADVQATDWHSLREVDIRRHNALNSQVSFEDFEWEDTMMYALGAEFDLNDAFTLRAGAAYDETPTNDRTRTPRLPDNDRMLYSVGLTWNASEHLSVDAAYTRIEIDSPSIDVRNSTGAHLVGKFKGHADLFGIAAQYKF